MSAMENTINHAQLQKEYIECMKVNLTPYVRSSPGIGKSQSVYEFANKFKLKVIDLRLSQCTPEDLQGFPMREGNKAVFTPFSLFPLEGEEKPTGMNGWILLLDELSSANKSVQAAAYKLILDRQVGSFNLHPDCYMIACGNNISDKAVVHKMSTALQSRMVHYDLGITTDEWVKWAMTNNIDYRITAFVQFKQEMLMNFKPDHTDNTYACPRTWEFLNRLINGIPKITRDEHLPRVAGTIGNGAAFEFLTFCEIQNQLPDWSDVVNPTINKKIAVPTEASARFAVTCWAAAQITKKELKNIIPFMARFGADFQVIFCRGVLSRFPNVDRDEPDFAKYAMTLIADLNDF